MNKRIILFSHDPGGANTIIPLIRPLLTKGYQVELFGKNYSLEKYYQAGFLGKDISKYLTSTSISAVKSFLQTIKPNFIITGTSSEDLTEKYFWRAGEYLKIPSFAVLDQWLNYGIRFSEYGVSELKKYNNDKKHTFLPTKILVMDKFAKKEMILEGFDSEKIIITGQPYFETLIDKKKEMTLGKIRKVKTELEINDSSFVITFASEPVLQSYKSIQYWGYTQYSIFREILKALKIISSKLDRKITIIIRIHPKEDESYYLKIKQLFHDKNITIRIDKKSESWKLILSSDLVCGMSSMYLLEAVILNKVVISLQIGLKQKNPFILDRKNIIKSILDRIILMKELQCIIQENKHDQVQFNFIKNPVENIIKKMEKYL